MRAVDISRRFIVSRWAKSLSVIRCCFFGGDFIATISSYYLLVIASYLLYLLV
jgi:hypothetical protein